jgi:maleate isomerase
MASSESGRSGAAAQDLRIGLIVPSSNVTMERELPEVLGRRQAVAPERFSFHSSRVRMRSVTPEALAAMNGQATRAAQELADARVDVVVYACLVALMAEGPSAHRRAESALETTLAEEGAPAPVVSSAGALVDTLRQLDARRIALIAPYLPDLTRRVCDYVAAEGVTVAAAHSLAVADNDAVGRLDPWRLLEIAERLPRDVDAVVLSACVQMPSLPAIEAAEARLGRPVLSTATATVYQTLRRLGLTPVAPGAGRLLAGALGAAAETAAAPASTGSSVAAATTAAFHGAVQVRG